jgi:hypothetical protein
MSYWLDLKPAVVWLTLTCPTDWIWSQLRSGCLLHVLLIGFEASCCLVDSYMSYWLNLKPAAVWLSLTCPTDWIWSQLRSGCLLHVLLIESFLSGCLAFGSNMSYWLNLKPAVVWLSLTCPTDWIWSQQRSGCLLHVLLIEFEASSGLVVSYMSYWLNLKQAVVWLSLTCPTDWIVPVWMPSLWL